jgi:hypothetical protein
VAEHVIRPIRSSFRPTDDESGGSIEQTSFGLRVDGSVRRAYVLLVHIIIMSVVVKTDIVLDPIDRETEEQLRTRVDRDRLEADVNAFADLTRVSGTEDEWTASEYVVDELSAHGVEAELLNFEALISVPESASVTVTVPGRRKITDAITVSFGASTSPGGAHGDVVFLDKISEEVVETTDIKGRIVFTRGLPTPNPICLLDGAGAVAAVFESVGGDNLHEMIASPIWGTPSDENEDALPDLPVAEITERDGSWIREKLVEGSVELSVETQVTTGLTTLPCPIGRIEGESDRYMIVGNHVDSWHEGVTDNATAMAATMELARVVAESDVELKRGLVFGFWPAHSTGRYAGSAWYADEHWLDLRENGVAYYHLDLFGLDGADGLWYQHMAELEDEHLDVLDAATNIPKRGSGESWLGSTARPTRNSDQSFWGTGLSSLLSGARLAAEDEQGGPIGGGWWWHTPHDTRDKVDLDVLVEETRIAVTLASRMCGSPVLPHDFTAVADDIGSVLAEIEDSTGTEFADVRAELDVFRDAIESANERIDAEAAESPVVAAEAEDLQVDLANELIPALYVNGSEYGHDPALPQDRLPYLQPAIRLPDLTGRDRRFAEISVRRGRNRLAHALRNATERTEQFL